MNRFQFWVLISTCAPTLRDLNLSSNQLTSVPAELGALDGLDGLGISGNQLTSMPAEWEEDGALEHSGCDIGRDGEGAEERAEARAEARDDAKEDARVAARPGR